MFFILPIPNIYKSPQYREIILRAYSTQPQRIRLIVDTLKYLKYFFQFLLEFYTGFSNEHKLFSIYFDT